MRNIKLNFLILSLVTFLSINVFAADVTISNVGSSGHVVSNNNSIGQSFTATKTGVISTIRIKAEAGSIHSGTLYIYDGAGNSSQIYSQAISLTADAYNNTASVLKENFNFQDIAITGTVNITQNSVYTFAFSGTTEKFVYANNSYASGQLYVGNGGTPYSTYDLVFEVVQGDATPSNPTVTEVNSTTANGTYGIDDNISITVKFSSSVDVNTTGGTPSLTLETGSTDRTVSYTSGSGSDTLTFTYTVQSGDTSSDLEYVATSSLALNGGTIKDSSSNDANLTLATPGTANSLSANKAIVIDTNPNLTSATYNAGTGVLTITGANLTAGDGIDETKFTLTGEGGDTYVLADEGAITATNATTISISLGSTNKNGVNLLLNKDGTSSTGGTTYNLAAAANWNTTSSAESAEATQAITVSNISNPTISSATYDISSGALVITGENFVKSSGSTNDLNISKLTLTGESGGTYTLTTSSVEVTSTTSASVTLSSTDQLNVHGLLNKNGLNAVSGQAYNLAAADNWMEGADASVNIADSAATITVSNVSTPTITSATYNANTGSLVVTGTNLVKQSGSTNDINVSTLTITGEGGSTHTLTTTDVEISTATSFTVTLNASDKSAVNLILNKDGTQANDGSTNYNLAATDDWNSVVGDTDISDATGNAITVSNVQTPIMSSATYNASTAVLVVTGTNFVTSSGSNNDIDPTKLFIRGQASESYTLTSSGVDVTSDTEFSVTLNSADQLNIHGILNKDGTSSADSQTYRIGANAGWMAASSSATDNSGDVVTVSNVQTPTITSATYSAITGELVVTGTNFVKQVGSTNDIDLTKLTFTGLASGTHTLTSQSSNVEITSATSFTATVAGTDKTAVNALINKSGTSATDSVTYNLAAADDWNGPITGGDIADSTASITATVNASPAISGTSSNQAVDDNVTIPITPFSSVTLDDNESDDINVTLTLDDSNKGTLSASTISTGTIASVQSSLRAITFTPAQNRVAPGSTEITTITITINDGTSETNNTNTTIVSTSINDTPVITSNSGGASANINVVENNTSVTTVTSTDADSGDTKTYSISGGADSSKFDINSSTGVLTFKSAPNYESPTDSGSDNTYVAIVQVSDANGSTDTQTLNVSVTNNTSEAPSVSLSVNNSNVAENSGTSTLTVTLSEAVSEDTNVTIGLKSGSSASSSDFNLSITTITINANSTTGTAIFTSLDDLIDDNSEIATIEITAVSGGENASENGTQEANITITDDDTAGVSLSKTTVSVDENGSTDSFTIKLDTQPTGNVIIDLNSSDTSEATISPSTLTFTSADWNTTQSVTITGIDDNIVDGDINSTITAAINTSSTADSVYDAISNKTVSVTTSDNDNAGFSISKTTASVDENGSTDSFTVVLDKAPTSNVVISVTSSDTTEATVSQSTLTFTTSNWDTNQTVTITGVDDSDTDGSVDSNITLSVADASSNDSFDPLVDQIVTVTTNDDDNQLPVITQGSSTTVNMSEDGNPTAFSLTLNATDGDNDTLTWSIETNATNGSASVSGTGNAKSISYNPNSNYNGSDSFVVKVEDTKNGSDTITVNVNIASINDLPLINTIFNNVSMNEDNGTTSYDVNISDLDNTDLNLTIESNNTSIMTVSSNFSSDINSSTYANLLDFNLTTVDNANGMVKITLTLSDGEANATTSFDVNISAVNDTPIINTVFNDISMNEDNGTTSYDINISDVDFTDLNLTVESNNTSLITVNPNFSSEINSSTYASLLDFNLTTVNDANGIAKITLTLTDGELNVTKTFDVNISAVNDVPVIETNLSNIVKDEDSASLFISLNTTDIDSNESSVVYSASSSDTSIATVQVVNGVLIVTPKDEANGEVTIDVNATVDGQTVTQTFTYTLNSINDRPNIGHIENIFHEQSSSIISKTISFSISDDTNVTSLGVSSVNTNLIPDANISVTKDSETSASLTYSIAANETGVSKITVSASDGNLSYSESFSVTVKAANDALCVDNTKTELSFDIIKNGNIAQNYIVNNLNFVSSIDTICSSTIRWSSSETSVIDDNGTLVGGKDATVAVSATITKGIYSAKKQFLLTVPAATISDASALENITFQDIKGTNSRQDEIVANLELNTSSLGKTVSWSSTNQAILDPYTGVVSRTSSDENVTLTADINGTTKTFALTVLAIPTSTADKLIKDRAWLNFECILDKNRDNNNIIYDLVKPLPTTAPNDSTITWSTSNSAVITTDGDVIRDSTSDKYITLTASFDNSGTTDTKEFLLRVLKNETTSSDTNVTFKQVIDNNDTLAVSFSENGTDTNTTANFDSSLVSKLEKIISDDNVKSVLELTDKIINLFLNTDGTSQSQAEFTNDNNESVISSVKMNNTGSTTAVDSNGTIVSSVAVDSSTTLKAELNSDGSVSHTVENTGGSPTTKATSTIPGSHVEADDAGNVETTSEIKSGNFIYKAVATSDKDGKTKTKFVTINLSTGEETEVDNTLDDSTPYAAGNTVEISEINGTVYIKTIAPLDGNLSVK